jgi:thiamine-monophosphate kinase
MSRHCGEKKKALMKKPGEFDLIDTIRKKCRPHSTGIVLGIGDDTAIVEPTPGRQLLVTTDALMEGVHFLPHIISPYLLGRKAVFVNLSDVAAMGGIPKFILLALALPESLAPEWIEKFYDGVESACEHYSLSVIGGNLSRSFQGIFLSVTLVGEVESGSGLQRNGAKITDSIFTTGYLGDAAGGVELALAGISQEGGEGGRLSRHLAPEPRMECGRFLLQNKLASACIDVSDGLSSDLHHICEASGVGAVIYKSRLPVSQGLRQCEPLLKKEACLYALNGGEDYELLFTVPEEKRDQILSHWPAGFPVLTEIGRIMAREEGVSLMGLEGKSAPLQRGGFDHFKK